MDMARKIRHQCVQVHIWCRVNHLSILTSDSKSKDVLVSGQQFVSSKRILGSNAWYGLWAPNTQDYRRITQGLQRAFTEQMSPKEHRAQYSEMFRDRDPMRYHEISWDILCSSYVHPMFIPQERQTVMFTATWPLGIRRLAADFLQNPVEVRAGEVDELRASQAAPRCIDCNDKWHDNGTETKYFFKMFYYIYNL